MKEYFKLPDRIISYIYTNFDKFIIFETTKFDLVNYHSYIFISPVDIIEIYDIKDIKYVFNEIESRLSKKYYIAGFFSYELGYGLDYVPNNNVQTHYRFPLAFFYVFKSPIVYDHINGHFINSNLNNVYDTTELSLDYKITNLHLNISAKDYKNNIYKIKKYIASGDTYQVNYTIKSKFKFSGSLLGLYYNLRKMQSVSYSSFIKTPKFSIMSFSPELFFRKTDRNIVMKPMKGTIAHGKNLIEDRNQKLKLFKSIKNRSENVMIVDLLRNDLGKISDNGEVNVKHLFEIENYETLFQMTSTITSKLKQDITLYDLFKAIFPSGSVTGAPKIRTMQIINELEKETRGVYTGAIGFFSPDNNAIFNVAIRTILIEGENGELGIGSGIVWDSDPKKEFEECKLKSQFFIKKPVKFRLIETMLWSGNKKDKFTKHGYFLLNEHIKRLKESASYFGFSYNENEILRKLLKLKERFNKKERYKVRLLLSYNGKIVLTSTKIYLLNDKNRIILSSYKTNPEDKFLYHKTTRRKLYNSEYKKYHQMGYLDVLFENKYGEITETSRGNIFIKIGKKYFTPPVKCGLLPGVYREYFIKLLKKNIVEKILTKQDIINADKIFVTNSVIGIKEVKIDLLNKKKYNYRY